MAIHAKHLARNQLDQLLQEFTRLKAIQRPIRGWIRAIRDALGMSGAQLGQRLGMTRQGVVELEKSEVSGAASIKTMQKAAEALDCIFVYALVPRNSLQATVEQQARKVAQQQLDYTAHTMRLEDQLPTDAEQQAAFENLVQELVRTTPKSLWD